MLFDTDILISQKIKRVKSNVFRLTYLVSIPMAIGMECYYFPTFKDLLAVIAPFFKGVQR
jgi:hypothetical protein